VSIVDLFFKRTAVDFLDHATERVREYGLTDWSDINPSHRPWEEESREFYTDMDLTSDDQQAFALSHFLENLGGGDPDAGLDLFKQLELSPDVSIVGHGSGIYGQVYILSDNSVVKVAPSKEEPYIKDLNEMSLTGMPEIYNIIDIPSSEIAHQEELKARPYNTPITNPGRTDVAIHMANAGRTMEDLFEEKQQLFEAYDKFVSSVGSNKEYFENFSGPKEWIDKTHFSLSEEDMNLFEQLWNNWALWQSLGIDIANDRHWNNVMVDESTNQFYFIDFGRTSTKKFHKEQEGLGRIMDAPATIGDALKTLTEDLQEGEESSEEYQWNDEALFNYVYSKLNEAFNFAYGPTQLTKQTNRFLKEHKGLSPEFIDSKLAEFESRFKDIRPMPSADMAWTMRPKEYEPVEEEMPEFFPGMTSD